MKAGAVAMFDNDYVAEDGPTLERSDSKLSVDNVMQSVRNIATVSEVLRILGAAVILASMSVFMLQGWSEGNDIRRYLLLLTQTGLLATAGFAMSHGLKETKGARVFFGLALVSIPANFTILGAMLYSVFQWDGGLTTYPGYATWQIENIAGTGATLGGAMFVLLPITLFCFAIMARHSAKALTLHFLLLNALLLLPIRSSMAAGGIALVGVLYALFVIGKLAGKDRSLKTGEGKFALATLFIPIGIILFRSMYFYQIDSLLVAMVSLAMFLSARQVSMFPDRSARLAVFLEVLSLPIAMITAMASTNAFAPHLIEGLAAPMFAAVYSVLALDVLRRTGSRRLQAVIGASISLSVALSFTLGVVDAPSALTALLSLTAGVMLVLWGISARKPVAMFGGLFTTTAGIFYGFDAITALILSSSWIDLAIFGASTIAVGSVLDRHGVAIKLRLHKWFNAVGEQKEQIALES